MRTQWPSLKESCDQSDVAPQRPASRLSIGKRGRGVTSQRTYVCCPGYNEIIPPACLPGVDRGNLCLHNSLDFKTNLNVEGLSHDVLFPAVC